MTTAMSGIEPVALGLPGVPARPLPMRRPSRRTGSGPVALGGSAPTIARAAAAAGTPVEPAMKIAEQMESDGAFSGVPEVTVG
ncbi:MULTISPECIES: hypothetical protein [unclassified Streptomyces]|uniref:hypothetical protein n=1 Tax=unclassified Streptomyces TaxID=2593676 RepID=UPI002033AF2F|nr:MULTISPECIES: hypothetical protein [unclassified Streptomyces]MCM2422563.1 hypothetical protein [Streptomyces sp. RKAG293]MCM2425241.1 hypothetical protein [Streptomyces sp. RKAG337]